MNSLRADTDTFYSRFFHLFLLVVIIIICYFNTLDAPWHFDDYGNIVESSSIRMKELSLNEMHQVVHGSWHDVGSNRRPVAALTFGLNYLYSGYDTTSYHVVNICLHLMTACFVYLVFLQTLYLYKTRIAVSNSSNRCMPCSSVALFGSVLWAIQPIHTQAVTYIVQRQAVMAAMFYMLAMYCYISARLSKKRKGEIVLILLAVMFYLLGMGSKQNAAMLPLSLIGYEVAFFRFSFLRSFRTSRVFQTFSFLVGIILTLILLLKGKGMLDYIEMAYGQRTYSMWERLLAEPVILFKYIFLLLTPLSDFLTLESDIIAPLSLFDPPWTICAVLAITFLGLLGLYLLRRQPILGFAIFFFFANHLMESTFFPLELYFEHRNYLPSMFLYLAISFFLVKVLSYYNDKKEIFMRSVFVLFGVMFLISEGNATFLRNDVWKSEITLMQDAIDKAPDNLRPYVTISTMFMRQGMPDQARQYLITAEGKYKENSSRFDLKTAGELYYNAAILYAYDWERKDIDKAIALLYKSCEIFANNYLAHMVLGRLLFEKGEYEQAEQAMSNAFALFPSTDKDMIGALHGGFGGVLYSNGNIDEAIEIFLAGVEQERLEVLQLNLVALYLKKGDVVRAKDILGQVPENNNTAAYLFCVALLNRDSEKGILAIDQLAGLLVENGVSYCDWIEKVRKNNFFGIIYPDIHSLESELKRKYLDNLARVNAEVEDSIVKVRGCNILAEGLVPDKIIDEGAINSVRN